MRIWHGVGIYKDQIKTNFRNLSQQHTAIFLTEHVDIPTLAITGKKMVYDDRILFTDILFLPT